MKLTGIKDVDREILKHVDDRELLTICSIDRRMWNEVCDDSFLRRRLLKYSNIEKFKREDESWKAFYLRAVHVIAKMFEKYQFQYQKGDFQKQYSLLKRYIKDLLLIEASKEGELNLVIHALKNGANIHAENVQALRWASSNGHLEVVKYLVEHGVNIHTGEDYALRDASENGHLEVVKYLVEHGANIHAQDNWALIWASKYGHLEVVKYLVEHGANVHAVQKALKSASSAGRLEVVKYLQLSSTLI